MKVRGCAHYKHTPTHTQTGSVLECARVSFGRRGGSQRGHLLFCFRAAVLIFEDAGVSGWGGVRVPTPTHHHFTGPHQPQRRRLHQSLELMADKIVCL